MAFDPDNLPQPLPQHVAIIMDGNGRWARQHKRPRHAGHRAGVRAAREVVERAAEAGVQVLTLFAFSSENWQRPPEEVRALMRLFVEVLQREVDALDENGSSANEIICPRFSSDAWRMRRPAQRGTDA